MVAFDPTDPDFIQNPYPSYARLRSEAPIFFYPDWGTWVLTRYHDIDRLLRDKRLGRIIHHLTPPEELPPAEPGLEPFDAIQKGSMLQIEPPDHPRIRAVVHDAFTPKHVRALGEKIARLCERLADHLEALPGRQADLITAFAEPLPVTVIADLLGVPEADRHQLLPWSKGIIGMFEPERSAAMERAGVSAAAAFADYLREELIPSKRAYPQDDLISRMVVVHDADPERLSEAELVANAILFLNAGHEAVVNVIGNGMLALLTHPEQLARLRADPALTGSAVEEMMRFDTPLQFFERYVLEDIEFEGVSWAKGTRLALYYGSANHDPEVFVEPEQFDIGRHPNPHIAFGLGIHFCVGAPLARVELAAAIGTLLRRFPQLELITERPEYQPKNVFRYLKELRVAY